MGLGFEVGTAFFIIHKKIDKPRIVNVRLAALFPLIKFLADENRLQDSVDLMIEITQDIRPLTAKADV